MISFQVRENLIQAKESKDIYNKLKSLRKIEILVGIPEQKTNRIEQKVTNAYLLALHTKGSPLTGLPARPVIEPALTAQGNSDRIVQDLRKIAELVLNNQLTEAKRHMAITGQDAVNMIRDWFEDPRNGWEPIKPETVAAKLRKTKKSLKKRQQLVEDYIAGEEGINQALVDTGQMKKAITYILREET